MWRIVFTCLCLVLSGCGYNTWWNPPFTSGSNPNFPAGDSENMRRVVGEQVDRRRSRRNRATSGRVRCSRSRPCRISSARASSRGLSNRCPARRNSRAGRPMCRRLPRAVAVRHRPGPSSRAWHRCPPPTAARPTDTTPPARNPAGQVIPHRRVPRSPEGAPAATRPSLRPGGGSSIVVPNGNGTSTIIHSDGRIETVPTPR